MAEKDNTSEENLTAAEAEEAPAPAEEKPAGEPDELAQARQEARDTYDKMLRLAAEFDNYKKRIEKERSIAIKYAEENILKELLPVIDNLERAVEQGRSTTDADVLLEGVDLTLKGLHDTLDKFGLKSVSDVGAPFDPNYHEALTMEASDQVPANHILREFQKGYLYKDRLIRAAKVVVSRGNG
ncbi:MAG: nucleotide exchange factor GrpE [Desulfobacteraceae bacterium]|nr:nucleotide exchange factor GrpE [Desulfobacteraceae bacterium]